MAASMCSSCLVQGPDCMMDWREEMFSNRPNVTSTRRERRRKRHMHTCSR
uniref:Uncharacterized protein n=1 Tax=Brassica oleracea TaxID=3712 RepID=A0A3P6F2B3_BRAOL|nr:unnamed protein product [Brassica oleracea]